MIEIYRRAEPGYQGAIDDVVELDHIQREKGRLKLASKNGFDLGVFLERGKILKRDEILQSRCNRFFQVALAKEHVVTAKTACWEDFSRACYHLGNRHTRLQIGERWLRFTEDPVLEELVERLGLRIDKELAEFDPESGAYGHGHAGQSPHEH